MEGLKDISEFYVDRMSVEDYDLVGRLLDFPGSDRPVGVLRVNLDDWRVYAGDIVTSVEDLERELNGQDFCDHIRGSAHGYDCGFEPISFRKSYEALDTDLGWDLCFESREVMVSPRAKNFFEEVFEVEDVESEYEVRISDDVN